MLRTFVVLVQIALLVLILRSSFAQHYLADVQKSLTDWMLEMSMLAERRQLAELQEAVMPKLSAMREYQLEYVQDITSDKGKLRNFHRMYCLDKDKNPYVYGAEMLVLCSAIRQSELLTD